MSVLASTEAPTRLAAASRAESAALDEEWRREPEHPGTACSPGWCLVHPLIIDGRVSHRDGYHRAEVGTVYVKWGVTIQVGLGQSFEGSKPVVHLRSLENDCNGEEPYDVVMSPDEAVALATHLQATAVQVRREISRWHAEGDVAG